MTLHRALVESRLQEILRAVAELSKHRGVTPEALAATLSLRWIIERGLLASAGLVFDVADHVLAAELGVYPESYEGSLEELARAGVISKGLYARMRGLGHVRNLLAHDYVKIDLQRLASHFEEALTFFPDFCGEVSDWLERASGQA